MRLRILSALTLIGIAIAFVFSAFAHRTPVVDPAMQVYLGDAVFVPGSLSNPIQGQDLPTSQLTISIATTASVPNGVVANFSLSEATNIGNVDYFKETSTSSKTLTGGGLSSQATVTFNIQAGNYSDRQYRICSFIRQPVK